LIIDKEETYFLSDWYFSKELCQLPIKHLTKEQLLQAKQELETLDHQNLQILDKEGNKVFDYAYAFEHLKATNKIVYHYQALDATDEEKQYIENELLASTRIRNGYVSALV